MDIKQAVISIDNLLAIHKQAEVTRFIGGDMQRADRITRASLLPSLINGYVSNQSSVQAQSIIHRIFAQRMHIFRPVIGQHQATLIRQANRNQPVHIANFSLAPDRGRDARCD